MLNKDEKESQNGTRCFLKSPWEWVFIALPVGYSFSLNLGTNQLLGTCHDAPSLYALCVTHKVMGSSPLPKPHTLNAAPLLLTHMHPLHTHSHSSKPIPTHASTIIERRTRDTKILHLHSITRRLQEDYKVLQNESTVPFILMRKFNTWVATWADTPTYSLCD